MKQFNLEEYKKNPNRRVITRDGRSVRIVCTDMIGTSYPILAICRVDATHDSYYSYTINGEHNFNGDSRFDLFFAPEKEEGWVNIYRDGNLYSLGGLYLYPSRSEAINGIVHDRKYVTTIKVEWKE